MASCAALSLKPFNVLGNIEETDRQSTLITTRSQRAERSMCSKKSSKSNLTCHAGKSPLGPVGCNNQLVTVDTNSTLTKTQRMNRKRKTTRNSKPQKKYNLITIWLKFGKVDWQPIPCKKRKGKADIVNISKFIDRQRVIVEIHRDCPQQVLSNVNWRNHSKLPNAYCPYYTSEVVLQTPRIGSNCWHLFSFAFGRMYSKSALESPNPLIKAWSDGVTLSQVKNLLHTVDNVNLPSLTLVQRPDIRFFNTLVEEQIGMFTCKGLIETRPNNPTENSKVGPTTFLLI